ncbi:MAG: GNAT family N-acetyltransferase [Xenococcaceae cyanobacterium MO_188.B32]|nr:GNAT family N-acetyltransferase [Xenococcaceae cyanobacterium MO_188.B32]
MNPLFHIKTPRLNLRYFTPNDLDILTPIFADPEVMHYSISGVKTRSQTEEFINRRLSQYQKYNFGLYAIVHQANQELIGYCGLLVWNFETGEEIEIGYRLARAYWGQGLATEAAIAVRDYAWKQLNINRLICIIDPDNIRSIRVAKKLGMNYEKDTVIENINVSIYSISSSDNLFPKS